MGWLTVDLLEGSPKRSKLGIAGVGVDGEIAIGGSTIDIAVACLVDRSRHFEYHPPLYQNSLMVETSQIAVDGRVEQEERNQNTPYHQLFNI